MRFRIFNAERLKWCALQCGSIAGAECCVCVSNQLFCLYFSPLSFILFPPFPALMRVFHPHSPFPFSVFIIWIIESVTSLPYHTDRHNHKLRFYRKSITSSICRSTNRNRFSPILPPPPSAFRQFSPLVLRLSITLPDNDSLYFRQLVAQTCVHFDHSTSRPHSIWAAAAEWIPPEQVLLLCREPQAVRRPLQSTGPCHSDVSPRGNFSLHA